MNVPFTSESTSLTFVPKGRGRCVKVVVGHSVVEKFPTVSAGLEAWQGIEVVRPRAGYRSFAEEMRLHRPDIVLTTDSLLGATVLALPQLEDGTLPPCKRVVLARGPSPTLLVIAAQAGFDDVVDVAQPFGALVDQLQELVDGKRHLRSHPIWKSLEYPVDMTRLEVIMADETDGQIVGLIAAGLSDREIADLVFLSCQTVRNRVSRLLDRCGARNRTQLALLYVRGQYERVVRSDRENMDTESKKDLDLLAAG